MGTKELGRALCLLGAIMVLLSPEICSGKAHFGYHARGGYYEGVWSERPISGINLQLVSVCAVVDQGEVASPESDPGYLHLAFEVSEEFEEVDITIRGPGNYLLDRVERDFEPGFNVFEWKSRIVEGLGIRVEELEPVVLIVGGMYIPCFVSERKPARMPPVEVYRVGFQTNIEGSIRYFVRDAGNLVLEGRISVSANVPAEVSLPVKITSDHMDLIAILDCEIEGKAMPLRQCFPIKVFHPEAAAARGD